MELHLVQVVADTDKKVRKVVKKVCIQRRKINLLKDEKIMKQSSWYLFFKCQSRNITKML